MSDPPDRYCYKLSQKVRKRVLYALNQRQGDGMIGRFSREHLLDEVRQKALVKYGGLRQPAYMAASISDDPLIDHFFFCTDDDALEFIGWVLQYQRLSEQVVSELVNDINGIFEDESVGYEFTPRRSIPIDSRPGRGPWSRVQSY